ncbi:nucleotide-binding protein [Propionigenium maris DSM 9537]|uniref:Nucleotide-binding protein n=1 Tax=Propionigenium maris DSM 9537 TaxID=1123000 RepID=A0A9W6LM77_9FUSO|nr:RNase adapter RapZ [Propionigenium maris]GLI55489.1 nucleotide-binding protein [Propionigenium maris DSM 9537]
MKGIEVVIVTGMSGAGKTVALNALEDMDYFVVDNVPYLVGSRLLKSVKKRELNEKKLALGMDIRSFEDINEFDKVIEKMKEYGVTYTVIFLDAEDNVILNRYNLSRRKHPVSEKTLLKSIERERELISDIRAQADLIIDTSYTRPVTLRRNIEEVISLEEGKEIVVHFQSFGFKYGSPSDLDMMFDVRCLPNPYYIEELRPKTGNDQVVRDYVMKPEVSKEYYNRMVDMLEFLIPNFIIEGKNHLSIGVGCSGGKHRSVTFINYLFERFSKNSRLKVIKSHREEERGNWD